MTWRELIEGAGCDPDVELVPALNLTAALLTVAARSTAQVRVDHADAGLSAERHRISKGIHKVLQAIGHVPPEFLRKSLVSEVCDVLDASSLRQGILALLAANELDARVGRTFVDSFRAHSGVRVRAGSPFPVVKFPCDRLPVEQSDLIIEALGRRTGDPRNRLAPVDRTDHLRLAPATVEQVCVRLVWADPWIEAVTTATRFAIGVTNDAKIEVEFDWRTYVVGAQHSFYGVLPKDCPEQKRRIVSVLDDATSKNATSVVLPELSLTMQMLAELRAEGRLEKIPLVVAGSFHPPQNGDEAGSNVCEVFAFGEQVLRHEKFSDFHYADGDERVHEHLSRSADASGFDLLLAPECSAAVLICKDVFGQIGDLLKELAPTVLYVPAMSVDTTEFEMLAQTLANDPQAFTVVSCAGPSVNAIFGRPNREQSVFKGSYEAPTTIVLGLSGVVSQGEPRLN